MGRQNINLIPTKNGFASLADDDMSDEIRVEKKPPKIRIPPITVFNVERKVILQAMTKLGIEDYSLVPLRRGHQIHCKTVENFKAVSEGLKQDKCEFYSHQLSSEKAYRVVLLGLVKMETEKLETLLKEVNVIPTTIKVIEPKIPRYEGHVNYTLSFEKNSVKLENLREIATIDKNKVRWEPFRSNHQGPTQCTRCMRPGHGSLGCYMPARCEFCPNGHLSKDCPTYLAAAGKSATSSADASPSNKTIDIEIPSYCCNCDVNGHFATSPHCPRRQKYMESHSKKRSNSRTTAINIPTPTSSFTRTNIVHHRPSPTTTLVEKEVSFASVLKPPTKVTQLEAKTTTTPNSTGMTQNEKPFTMDEVIQFTAEISETLGDIKTAPRSQIMKQIMQLSLKYLYDERN